MKNDLYFFLRIVFYKNRAERGRLPGKQINMTIRSGKKKRKNNTSHCFYCPFLEIKQVSGPSRAMQWEPQALPGSRAGPWGFLLLPLHPALCPRCSLPCPCCSLLCCAKLGFWGSGENKIWSTLGWKGEYFWNIHHFRMQCRSCDVGLQHLHWPEQVLTGLVKT